MIAVLDTGVVVAGIFWKAEPHRCLVSFAYREYSMVLTEPVFAEYVKVAWRLKQEEKLLTNPEPWLAFIRDKCRFVIPVPLQKRVCRDPNDDMFIECALGGSANVIVSRDEDLLALEKPHGIEVVTPRQLLRRLR